MKSVTASRAGFPASVTNLGIAAAVSLGLGVGLGACSGASAAPQAVPTAPAAATPAPAGTAGAVPSTTSAPSSETPTAQVAATAPGPFPGSVQATTVTTTDASVTPTATAAAAAAQDPASETAPSTTPATPPRVAQTSILLEVQASRPDLPVSVAFYRDAEAFARGEDAVRTLLLDRTGPVTRAFVLGLPPGRYALVVWQDVDGDRKPTRGNVLRAGEPIAYSGPSSSAPATAPAMGAGTGSGRTGQPSFEAAAFDLGAGGLTLRLNLP